MFNFLRTHFTYFNKNIYNVLMLCVFLCCSFYGYTQDSNAKNTNATNTNPTKEKSALAFVDVIQQIESLKNQDLVKAIKLSTFYDQSLSKYTITERITFKKLQAELFIYQTNYQQAKRSANQGLNLTKQLAHPSIVMAELLNSRGFAIESLGHYDDALEDYMAALEISQSLNDRKVIVETLINLGAIYYITEKYQRSLVVLNDALSLSQALDDDKMLGLVYLELGTLYTYFKLENKVKEFHLKAHEYFLAANEPYLALTSLQNIAITYAKNNNIPKAITLYKEIIIEAKKMGNVAVLANTYSEMAEVYLTKEYIDPHTAYHYILIAEEYISAVEEASYEVIFLINKANVLKHLARYSEALEVINYAEGLLPNESESIKTYSILELLRIKSEIYYELGSFAKAYAIQKKYHQQTREIDTRNNMPVLEGIRINYESKQHEHQAKALEKKKRLQSLELKEVNKAYQDRTFYIFIGVITVVGLAWFYVINLNNQKRLLDSRDTDHLTDLPNRQTILSTGSAEFHQLSKKQRDYSVLMIKVDNFTNINQVKGYDTGNSILIEISLIILKSISAGAQCGKYSGNEFIVLLPNTNAQNAEAIANKIHQAIYKKSWDKYGLKVVSVSIGMSNNQQANIELYEALIRKANTLKQQAVVSGGNSVCV